MVFLSSINTASFTGTSILISLVIIAVPTIIIAVNSLKNQRKKKKELPPLPPPGPTFQEYLDAMRESRVTASQQEWVNKYGRLFLIKSPLPGILPEFVGVSDPAIAKELCIRQANQYRAPSRFTTRSAKFAAATRDSVGASLAGEVGEAWRWRRAAFLKEMHKSKLFNSDRKLVEQIFHVGENLCAKLEKAAESKEPVKVDILATEAAFDTILFFIFGKVLSGYNADEIRLAAKDILGYLFASLMSPVFRFAKYVPGTSANMALKKRNAAWKVFDSLVVDEIELMLKEAKRELPRASDRLPGSILESWLAKEPKFFERSLGPIVAEVRGMVLAGFETTAHSLAYAFGMMAEDKELADKLHTIAKKALNQGDQEAALEEAVFLKNFFMEALRLHPLAPALTGECTEDITLPYEGKEYGFPKGTTFLFFNFVMQRHKDYCKGSKGPDEIEPDRWDVASGQEQPFLHTFNNGPHACPGKPLSVLEGHIFLLQVASRFDFSFPEGIDRVLHEEQMLLRPKDAMPLHVTKR